ncbi:hypothetical protein FHETE_5415 [Fusarium heterosporum]|uniref:Uncharacterized protein n=1 Tax=Fusarium heterosporum TaxID=42747 RepID=A0A8H5WS69_FUSHE|nr:hypothetical protein FHETE_5415 [Fusarium heterosporum]
MCIKPNLTWPTTHFFSKILQNTTLHYFAISVYITKMAPFTISDHGAGDYPPVSIGVPAVYYKMTEGGLISSNDSSPLYQEQFNKVTSNTSALYQEQFNKITSNTSALYEEQLKAMANNWNEFCQWWQKPQNLFAVLVLTFVPLFIFIVYYCLKGKKWGWGWSDPFGFFTNKNKDKEEQPEPILDPEYDVPAYTASSAQPGVTGWNQLYPLPSTTSLEHSWETTLPCKGMDLATQKESSISSNNLYSGPYGNPYGNPYSGSAYRLEDLQSNSSIRANASQQDLDEDISNTGASPSTFPGNRDLTTRPRPLSLSSEAPPAYEYVQQD